MPFARQRGSNEGPLSLVHKRLFDMAHYDTNSLFVGPDPALMGNLHGKWMLQTWTRQAQRGQNVSRCCAEDQNAE